MADQDRWSRQPKSKGRYVIDVVLFGIAAVFLFWAGLSRLDTGEIDLKSGGVVRLANSPAMFWLWLAAHLAVGLICAFLSYRAVRGLLRLQRGEPA